MHTSSEECESIYTSRIEDSEHELIHTVRLIPTVHCIAADEVLDGTHIGQAIAIGTCCCTVRTRRHLAMELGRGKKRT